MKVISKKLIEEIRAQNDIAEVLGTHLQLKRAGSSFKTLCPFHKEKTPSFHVNPQRQIYHCFGCGAGGDVFRFIMEYEGVDFATAVRMLADRVGIRLELEEDDRRDGVDKDVLYRIHEEATMLFHRILKEKREAEVAREYLRKRRLDEGAVADFLIGYALDRPDTMLRLAEKKGFTPQQLETAGLVVRPENPRPGAPPWLDRFRGRLMFPIRDEIGRVIGFSGRILDDTKRLAKYVNSPETPLFRKSRVLFAFDKARRHVADERTAILVEGQIDAIRCHVSGINNVVASQGTALTEEHARLIRRYADSVVLVLDADVAGQDAAVRAIDPLVAAGLSLTITALPAGEDPDSMILKNGPDAFRALVRDAKPSVEFQIDILLSREDFGTEAGRTRIISAIAELVARVPKESTRVDYVNRAAQRLNINDQALRDDMMRLRSRARDVSGRQMVVPSKPTPTHPTEELTLCELLAAHAEVAGLVRTYLPLDALTDPVCRRLVERLLEPREEGWSIVAGRESEDEAYVRLAARVEMAPTKIRGEEVSPQGAAKDLVLVIRRKALDRRRQAIRDGMSGTAGPERERMAIECQHLAVDINLLRQGWDKALPLLELSG